MPNLTGSGLVAFGKSKIGTPYVYGCKGADGPFTQSKYESLCKAYPSMFTSSYKSKIANKHLIGKVCCDCSGLISWYTGKALGSSQLYSTAYARLPMSDLNKFAVGTVLWKPGHVGIFAGKDANGKPICIEEKGIDYGCVSGIINNPNRWSNGLTFNYINYVIETPINNISYKSKNPYAVPTTVIKRNSNLASSVKWIQFELIESGYGRPFKFGSTTYKGVHIDGVFGPTTYAAVKAFQSSAKLTADGEVGPNTIKALIAAY